MLPSSPTLTICLSSGVKASAVMERECPATSARATDDLKSQSLTMPEVPPVAIMVPSLDLGGRRGGEGRGVSGKKETNNIQKPHWRAITQKGPRELTIPA